MQTDEINDLQMKTAKTAKPAHLVDHLNLSEGQTVQPVNLHHVALTMGLCQLGRKMEGGKRGRGNKKKKKKRFTTIQNNYRG